MVSSIFKFEQLTESSLETSSGPLDLSLFLKLTPASCSSVAVRLRTSRNI
ncbi:hypothetical protein LguiA_033125 [Lonicera macranthoides]